MKVVRRIIIILLILAAVAGTTVYFVFFYKTEQREPVKDVFSYSGDSVLYGVGGEPVRNQWFSYEGKRYYIGENGKAVKDSRLTIDGKEYLFDKTGALETDKIFLSEDVLYTIDEEGVLTTLSGWATIDGKQYYGGESGAILKGWKATFEGKDYYFGEDGVLATDQIFLYQGKVMKAGEDGILSPLSGWQQVNGVTYYADRDGSVVKNSRVKRDSGDCYLDSDGQMVKNGFYTYEDNLYYADQNGDTRTEQGWLTVDGKQYYSGENGAFYRCQYIKVDGEKCFVDKNGAKIDGKPTIDQYLGCDDIYGWMTDHFSDFYFKTPYRDLYGNTTRPERLIRPYGLFGDDAGMNCTGFISSLVYYSGGDLSKVSDMGRFGGYGNADNYLRLALSGNVQYKRYNSVSEFLKSGDAKKGNILYLAPKWKSGMDCHMGVFWGDTSSENKLWSQTYATLCTVTEIYMIDPINQIFMFPIERNLSDEE